MAELWEIVSTFLLISLYAATVQNLLLTRIIGADPIVQERGKEENRVFFLLQGICCFVSAILFWLCDNFLLPRISVLEQFGISSYYARAYLWPLFAAVIMTVVFLAADIAASYLVSKKTLRAVNWELPSAAFNNFICAVLFRASSNNYGFFQMLAFTVGCVVGYNLAFFFIREGQKKLEGQDTPAAFRGLPATLLYLTGLALAVYALSGSGVATLM